MSSMGAGANASDLGLIVQGTLIFLSACVGVFGYLVQARSKQKQYLRETQIRYLRHVLDEIIGPAQSLGSSAKKMRGEFYASVVYRGRGMTYKEHMNDIFGEGAMRRIIDGKLCQYRRFVSSETEVEMTNNPQGFLATQYRRFMRIFVRQYHRPLADLIKLKHCSLPLPSRDEFKRRFPGHKSGTLRKTFWLWQASWTAEMEAIIAEEWDQGIFKTWFPVITPFPTHLTSLNTGILNDVKNEIERLTKGGLKHNDKRSMKEQTAINKRALDAEAANKKLREDAKAAAKAAAAAANKGDMSAVDVSQNSSSQYVTVTQESF